VSFAGGFGRLEGSSVVPMGDFLPLGPCRVTPDELPDVHALPPS